MATKTSLSTRLARIAETPVAPAAVLRGELPADLEPLIKALQAETEAVAVLRARLDDAPPAARSAGSVLL